VYLLASTKFFACQKKKKEGEKVMATGGAPWPGPLPVPCLLPAGPRIAGSRQRAPSLAAQPGGFFRQAHSLFSESF